MEGGFAHSPIRLNRSLSTLEHWTNEGIEKRAQALADIAVNVWSVPQLSPEQISKYNRQTQRIPLAEVIGPFEHPMAGFIPEGFKVVQISERKFHYYRLVEGEWIQYGNGKDAWYAISWDTVGRWTRDFYKKGIMPLGVGGELNPRFQPEIIAQYPDIEEGNGNNGYTLEDYPGLQGNVREVFEQLRKRILNLDSSVREEYKKLYIAYKTTTNFVDIEPQKKKLLVTLNMKFDEINDPEGLCRDVTHIGHFGNGDIEIAISSLDQIEDVMDLVRQSFERHWEEVDA